MSAPLVPEDATICSSDPTAAVSAQRSFTASWRPVYAACGIGKFMPRAGLCRTVADWPQFFPDLRLIHSA